MRFHPPKQKSWPIVSLVVVATLAFLLPTALCLFAIWGASTLSYRITPDEVLIVFGPTTARIERQEIESVQLLDRPTPTRRARLAGTTVPGHHLGRWSMAETGPVTLYATTLQSIVLLETENGKWGMTPHDAEGFVATLQEGGTGTFAPVPAHGKAGLLVYALIPLVLFALLGYPVGTLLRIRRSIGYELASDRLIIHGAWKPIIVPYTSIEDAKRIGSAESIVGTESVGSTESIEGTETIGSAESIKNVEITQPSGAPSVITGIHLPGLYWGTFTFPKVSRNLKLYATRLRPLVLIKGGDTTYGLSPEEPERFAAALKERLSARAPDRQVTDTSDATVSASEPSQ